MSKSIKDFVLTIKEYTDFQGMNLGDDFLSEVQTVHRLTGISPNKITNADFDYIKGELAQQTIASEPVYLVRWKGKVYGYYPAELETIGDVVELATLCKTNKWNLLTAFMFRELKWASAKMHGGSKGWKKFHGVDVKFISNFSVNLSQYSVKKIHNWKTIDYTIWDDFPFEIMSSNVNFLVGNGLSLSLNIHASSRKLQENQMKAVMKLQTLMGYMASFLTSLKSKQMLHRISGTSLSQTSRHVNSLTFLQENSSKELLKSIASDVWIFNGQDNTDQIHAYVSFCVSLFLEPKITPQELRVFGTINNAILQQARQNFSIKQLIQHG